MALDRAGDLRVEVIGPPEKGPRGDVAPGNGPAAARESELALLRDELVGRRVVEQQAGLRRVRVVAPGSVTAGRALEEFVEYGGRFIFRRELLP